MGQVPRNSYLCWFPAAVAAILGRAHAGNVIQYDAFHPGDVWLDTDGARIKAHSGGLLEVKGTTYWYGAEGYQSGDNVNRIINVYSSVDLYNWQNHGRAFNFNCSQVPGSGGHCYADRPKVLHDKANGRFVMWLKSTPWVAVAIATSPLGPFEFVARWYPNGVEMGDPTAFEDPVSGRSYYIYSVKPGPTRKRVLHIAPMQPDLLNITDVCATIDSPREAPAAFYDQVSKNYYIWTSHTTGWDPNPASVYMASSICAAGAEWRDLGNPTHNSTSFGSQSTYILPLPCREQCNERQRFIYVADRFRPYMGTPEYGRYIWLPLDLQSDGVPRVQWHDSWSLDGRRQNVRGMDSGDSAAVLV